MAQVNTQQNRRGFTLVETMVAISILSISILGIFTAVQNGLATSGLAKDQITAFYLVQESMEYIRNMRDENGLKSLNEQALGRAPVAWLSGIANISSDPCYPGNTCTVDSSNSQLTRCSGGFGTCPFLLQDTNTLFFGYTSGWTQTKFKREIQIQSVNANEIIIVVQISWTSGVFSRTIQVKQSLYNLR
ncbi:MAG: hypothetical protein QG589_27 [Patescibacteria group bacterium]|nr:hypothetical protein [Patescibacteria group bacterium]